MTIGSVVLKARRHVDAVLVVDDGSSRGMQWWKQLKYQCSGWTDNAELYNSNGDGEGILGPKYI